MTCEHSEHLLDLVYGELDDAEATALRREVEACEACREELAELEATKRLADQLPLEPMPSAARSAILAAARDQAAANAGDERAGGSAEIDAGKSEEKTSIWASVLEWARGLTAGPQVAMATVMLLVVAIGVWYLPQDRAPEVGTTVMRPDPEGEVAPSELAEPAAPVEVLAENAAEADALDGESEEARREEPRDRTAEEDANGQTRLALRTDAPEAERADTDRETRGQTFESERPARPASARATAAPLEEPRVAEAEPPPVPAEPAPSPEPSPRATRRARAEAQQAQLDGTELPSYADDGLSLSQQAEAEEGAAAAAPSAERSAGAPSPNTIEPMDGSRATYQRAMSSYRRRDYRTAAEEFEAVVQSPRPETRELLPSALHHLARSHRQRGACAAAVQHYANLFRRFPDYRQVPEALLESVDCHRRLGRLREARRLLNQAARFSRTQAEAQRELRRLDTLDRAQRAPARAMPAAESYDSAY